MVRRRVPLSAANNGASVWMKEASAWRGEKKNECLTIDREIIVTS
jgi:hypothetical protein